ncbi:hypothetical protein [Pseudactinotalea sp.]|uniref:hypothetical protein n=1 Tax=Pseudactinotalea sp. TaxID=1926260 RepID=UPI003B3ACE84
MPRASQMPRTRRLRTLRTAVYFTGIALVAAGGAVARAVPAPWYLAIAGFVAFGAVLLVALRPLVRMLDRRVPTARSRDLAALTPEERALPFGVIAGADGELLLPTKISLTVLAWVLAAGLVGGGVAMLLVDDAAARTIGTVTAAFGAWTGVLAAWVTGTRIRLTDEGIESRMGPRRFYRWLEIPDLKVDRQIVILRAAGAPRPRVWIRVGTMEVSVADCVAMIRKVRGW